MGHAVAATRSSTSVASSPDAAPAWRALAEQHGGRLVVDAARARVSGDALRLAQACANLVANAVEHGGGLVHVRVGAAGGHVRVEVADDGAGLPAPVTALVAAARGRRSHRGHGLAIAAAIARRHGGRLTSAARDRGACVVLELPGALVTLSDLAASALAGVGWRRG